MEGGPEVEARSNEGPMAVAVSALRIVRSSRVHVERADADEVVLRSQEREWVLPVKRFQDYRRDAESPIITARAYILPAEEEDGLYAHAAWIGDGSPPSSTPKRSRSGHVYLNRYLTVPMKDKDGTWISLRSRTPLNEGKIRVVERLERGGELRYERLSVPAIATTVLIVKEDHFSRYNFTGGLKAAFLLAASPDRTRLTLDIWADTQMSSGLSVPRTLQGTHTLSAVIKYSTLLTLPETLPDGEKRTTSISLHL